VDVPVGNGIELKKVVWLNYVGNVSNTLSSRHAEINSAWPLIILQHRVKKALSKVGVEETIARLER